MSGAALIMIGAGEAQDLPADWQHTYDRLILIEPIPEVAAALRDRFSGVEPVETIEAAIVGDADGAEATTLHVFSWQALSSRYAPAELLNLFPGLEVDRALRVRAVTLSQLLETCELEADADNWLLIDAPGEGLPIVQSLIEGEWREAFTRVSVREPAQGLYDTTSGPDPIADTLQAAGFSQDAIDTQDPEWPSLTFSRNRWKLRSERLAADVERLTAELAERDQQAAQATELEERLQAKEAQLKSQAEENAELQRRQSLMNEELSKAEAQIDLIKDLLFKQTEEKA